MWWLYSGPIFALDVIEWLHLERMLRVGVLNFYIIELFFPLAMLASLVVFARHRLQTAVAALLLGIFWTIITINQFIYAKVESESPDPIFAAIAMLLVLPLILLSVAPAKAISRRLIFLAIGLLFLIALNELSKLGLDVTAPKLQG